MAILKILYSSNISLLEKHRNEATHWLPEKDLSIKPFYKPPEVICTTAGTMLETISTLIKSGELNHNKVIYIDIENEDIAIAYVFKADGSINNFFRI